MEQFYIKNDHKFLVKRIIRANAFRNEEVKKAFLESNICFPEGEMLLVVEPVPLANYVMIEPVVSGQNIDKKI